MDLCRICLSTSPDKDISELKISAKHDNNTYLEILSFCLDIQVPDDSKITTKLCRKCYKKIILYHKFKTLALKNDHYLKSIKDSIVKLEVFVKEDDEYSNNNDPIQIDGDPESSNDCLEQEIKEESEIKDENDENNSHSDEKLLSVLKKIKEEDPSIIDQIPLTENNLLKVKKRGRPKKAIKEVPAPSKKQTCDQCGESVWDLKQHSVKHLPVEDRKRIQCKVCEKKFSSYGARYRHNKVKHLGIKYRCEICGKEVTSLKNHMLRIHSPEKLKLSCMLCDRRFLSQSLLESHLHMHTNDKPYECDVCHKKFRTKVVMSHHKRQVHELEKSHLCQFCSKSFFKKYHLIIHLRSHTKEKPYKCEECGRAFASPTTCKNHKLTHNTERNFQCDLCDMKFVRIDYLRVHMVCHTKVKKHPCKYCGVRFGRSDHRKRHQYTAHEKHLITA